MGYIRPLNRGWSTWGTPPSRREWSTPPHPGEDELPPSPFRRGWVSLSRKGWGTPSIQERMGYPSPTQERMGNPHPVLYRMRYLTSPLGTGYALTGYDTDGMYLAGSNRRTFLLLLSWLITLIDSNSNPESWLREGVVDLRKGWWPIYLRFWPLHSHCTLPKVAG